jgi:hypothetical protein
MYRWLRGTSPEQLAFREAHDQALAEVESRLAMTLFKASLTQPRWALELLTRRFPARWGRPQAIVVDEPAYDSGPAEAVVVNPVGANTSGSREGRPRIGVEVSTYETSWKTLGTNSIRAKVLARSTKAGFALRCAVQVVEHGSRGVAPRDRPQAPDRRGGCQAPFHWIEMDRSGAEIGPELGPA